MPSSPHVRGVHEPPSIRGVTHFEGASGPPQRKPVAHVPQLCKMPPQPSPAGPHSTPSSAHVRGLQKPLLNDASPKPPTLLSLVLASEPLGGTKTESPPLDPQATMSAVTPLTRNA